MVDVCLILNLSEGPALRCDFQWPAVPRIGDYVKLPTHPEYTFKVKSIEWTMHGEARVTLTPKADVKVTGDLMTGRDPWQSDINQGFPYPKWREYYPENGSSTPYRK